MEQKNRIWIAVAIIALITAAVFTSFGWSLFALNTPRVELASPNASGEAPGGIAGGAGSGLYQAVEVTPQTVQRVIGTLGRPESFYRELSTETFWEGGSASVPVQVWSDGGWTHSRQGLPSGAVRHELVGEGTLYYWYEGTPSYRTAPADQYSADLSQRIPTYETVLDLDPECIRSAGYELWESLPCIQVEVALEEPERLERYWVSVDSGLLVAAETWQGETLLYRMTDTSGVVTPCPADASFALPDGTQLHTLA